jgi:subtilisin family serine protease
VFAAKSIGDEVDVSRRYFAVLMIVLLLVVAAVPLAVTLSDSSSGVGSSFGFVPSMVVPEGVDEDGNRIEDLLDVEIEQKIAEGNGSQLVDVVVLLRMPPSSVHTSAFRGNGGGEVRGSWRHAVFGFAGRLPYVAVSKFAGRCPNLLLVQRDHEYDAVMAYAARQGRARPIVWDTLGYRGDPQSSIAISDSGIDDSHVNHGSFGDADFSKKIVGWRDDVGSSTTPYDDNGHGSHCAGIAAGSGFYSTDVDGRAVATWSAKLQGLLKPYIYLVTGFNVSQSGSGNKITLQAKGDNVDTLYLYYSGFSGDPYGVRVATYSIPSDNTEYVFEYDIPEGEVGYYHLWIQGKGTVYLGCG